jgi:hypothetical protein
LHYLGWVSFDFWGVQNSSVHGSSHLKIPSARPISKHAALKILSSHFPQPQKSSISMASETHRITDQTKAVSSIRKWTTASQQQGDDRYSFIIASHDPGGLYVPVPRAPSSSRKSREPDSQRKTNFAGCHKKLGLRSDTRRTSPTLSRAQDLP